MSEKIDEIKAAQEEAGDIVSMRIEGDGARDVIGIEVLSLHGDIKTDADAEAHIAENTTNSFGLIEVEGQMFVVKTTVANLNKVNMVDPMDLQPQEAIPIQVKISEMLEAAGLDVGINEEMKEQIQEEMDKAKAELNDADETGVA